MIDSGVRGNTSYLLCQARLRVEELASANHRKDEFLAMLGHELRNPLAAIHNGIHLLSQQTQSSPAPQKIKAMIERQIRRMTQLVDDLLDVSRITHGRLRLQRERIDLRDVVSNAIQTLESDIKQRNHRLTTALPDAPVWLQADPGRLEQVFVNLLGNASKYTDTGKRVHRFACPGKTDVVDVTNGVTSIEVSPEGSPKSTLRPTRVSFN
jgi:signal transduction histidine kinase